MGFNFGSFAGGLAQGVEAGQRMLDIYDKAQIRKATRDEMDTAGKMADDMANGMVKQENGAAADSLTAVLDNVDAQKAAANPSNYTPMPGTDTKAPGASVADFIAPKETGGSTPVPGAQQGNDPRQHKQQFRVGDAVFDSRDKAVADAKKKAPDKMDLFLKNGAAKIQAKYLEQGDPAKAAAWEKYVAGEKGRRNMTTWADSYKSAMSGDFMGTLDGVAKLYNAYDPDTKITGREILKGEDGNPVGAVLKYERDGKEAQIHVDPKTLLEMGVGQLTPEVMFESMFKRESERESSVAKAKTEAIKGEQQMGRVIAQIKGNLAMQGMRGGQAQTLEGIKQGNALERMNLSHDQKKSLEQIRQAFKGQEGGDAYGKRRNPEDRIQAFALKLQDNPDFAGLPQDKIIEAAVAAVKGIDTEAAKMRGGAYQPEADSPDDGDLMLY